MGTNAYGFSYEDNWFLDESGQPVNLPWYPVKGSASAEEAASRPDIGNPTFLDQYMRFADKDTGEKFDPEMNQWFLPGEMARSGGGDFWSKAGQAVTGAIKTITEPIVDVGRGIGQFADRNMQYIVPLIAAAITAGTINAMMAPAQIAATVGVSEASITPEVMSAAAAEAGTAGPGGASLAADFAGAGATSMTPGAYTGMFSGIGPGATIPTLGGTTPFLEAAGGAFGIDAGLTGIGAAAPTMVTPFLEAAGGAPFTVDPSLVPPDMFLPDISGGPFTVAPNLAPSGSMPTPTTVPTIPGMNDVTGSTDFGKGLLKDNPWLLPLLGVTGLQGLSSYFQNENIEDFNEDAMNRWRETAFLPQAQADSLRTQAYSQSNKMGLTATNNFFDQMAKRGLRGGSGVITSGLGNLERGRMTNLASDLQNITKMQNTPMFAPPGMQPNTSMWPGVANTASTMLGQWYNNYLNPRNDFDFDALARAFRRQP